MKKIVSLTMALIMLISLFTFNVSAQENVLVYIDGEKIEFDVQPQIINGRTLVPMRKIFEELGAVVDWDNSTQTAIGTKNNTTVKITINDNNIYKNGVASTLDVPAQLIDGRTLVPVRAISEAFGVDVFWRGEINTVSIHSSENIEYIKMYNTDFEPVDVEKVLKQLYLEKGWTDNIVNESLNSGLTLLKGENLVYSNFNNVYSIDNILPGLKCWTHNEISDPEFNIYVYYYSYGTKTLEDAEKYAMQYARYLQSQGYKLICEMDDPVIIQSKGTDMVYELVTPDNKYLVEIKSEYRSYGEHQNDVKVSIEYFNGESTRANYDGYFNPSEINPNNDIKKFQAGHYIVGRTIPVGRYILISDESSGYFAITSDINGNNILVNDLFGSVTYIDVVDETFLELSRCYAIPYMEDVKFNVVDNGYVNGTYKCGKDLPAGIYELSTANHGYYAIYNTPYGRIETNDGVDGNKYVTVKEGQYITLNNVKVTLYRNDSSSNKTTANKNEKYDNGAPTYTAITGIELKEKLMILDSPSYKYQYTVYDDVRMYMEALEDEGWELEDIARYSYTEDMEAILGKDDKFIRIRVDEQYNNVWVSYYSLDF